MTTLANLPVPISDGAAAWSGTHVYLFGGSTLLRYHPATDTSEEVLGIHGGPQDASAVWIGDAAYVFGGYDADLGGLSDRVLRFRPSDGTWATMGATLPSPRFSMAATTDGTVAYLFGGVGSYVPPGAPEQILRYDPASDTLAVVGTLPHWVDGGAAVYDGNDAFVLGGACLECDNVIRFDPSTQQSSVLGVRMEGVRQYGMATWDGTNIHFFGGKEIRPSPTGPSEDIVRVNPLATPPGPPADLGASPQLAIHLTGLELKSAIRLTWEAPADTGHVALWRFLVYGGNDPGALALLATLPADARSYTDTSAEMLNANHYQVRAVNVAALASEAAAICAHTYPWVPPLGPPGGCP